MEHQIDMSNFLSFKPVYAKEQISAIRKEFSRLEDNHYLDHAGATLYSEKQLQEVFSDFSHNLYANPHASSVAGKSTEDAVDIVRYQILEHFNTNQDEYSVIFTSSATAALKIVAECFDYGSNGTFLHLETNHTSVLGMRCYSKHSTEVKVEEAFNLLSKENPLLPEENSCNNIFVYPAQCNFSGTKYPLEWVDGVRKGLLNKIVESKSKNWYVVLDCANYSSTNKLNLSLCKPDFVPLSFYKLFGFPSGIGALLMRKSSENVLRKRYFGGGTVFMALSTKNVMIPRETLHERFEDGTLPFLSILAIKHGFNVLKRLNLNFDIISSHTFSLSQFAYRNLLSLHHYNRSPVAILYHDTVFETKDHQGGIVNFNLLRANGEYVGYSEVMHMANLHGIHLRTGCFCNPGACQRFLNLHPDDVYKQYKAGHICGDQTDLVNGYPTGSVRVSFGYMTTPENVRKFLQMIETCFVEAPALRQMPRDWQSMKKKYLSLFVNESKPARYLGKGNLKRSKFENTHGDPSRNDESVASNVISMGTLQQILLYPIKSCGAFSVDSSWELTRKGLRYDREWMIINSAGICLTQKHNKKLCLIKPCISLETNSMILEFKGQPSIEINLDGSSKERSAYLCNSKVCGDRVQGLDCGDAVSDWLSNCLETPGMRLIKQYDDKPPQDSTRALSFANKAQYLLINTKSVEWLMSRISNPTFSEDLYSVVQRFRPNFVVNLDEPFLENGIDELKIDGMSFQFVDNCTRCQMICINQMTGIATKEPLVTLSKEFKGKVSFGIYLKQNDHCENSYVHVGSKLIYQ